jgi:hypothetical protein
MPQDQFEELQEILLSVCDKETSQDPDGWVPNNPLWGHCAVVALVVQDIFGGELLRASLEKYPEFAHMRSHYFNRLPDGTEVDFTKPQFGDKYPTDLKTEVRSRDYVVSFLPTVHRYALLSKRVLARRIWHAYLPPGRCCE